MTPAVFEREVSVQPRTRLPFAIAIFSGSFLLFQVQPILARYILPWFGGTTALWTTCMLFFQVVLLMGYLYSHTLSTKLQSKTQARVHSLVLAITAVVLAANTLLWKSPLLPGAGWRPSSPEHPILHVLAILSMAVGTAFLVLSSTGPLMQHWFSGASSGESPYRLYSLSNLGSLLGLVTYPILFEPVLGLHTQALIWCAGYAVFLGSSVFCVLRLRDRSTLGGGPESVSDEESFLEPAPTTSTQILWFLLSGVASLMLLATTNRICQDVAVVPFLWVLPLALYLASLIICFDNPRWYRRGIFQTLLAVTLPFAVLAFLKTNPSKPVPYLIAVLSVVLFACCMVCHGELVRLRPHPEYLTRFYFVVSAGGAAGGIFVALLAPRLFSGYWEFETGLTASVLLAIVLLVRDKASWWYSPPPALGLLTLLGLALTPYLYVTYMGFPRPPRMLDDIHYYGLLTVFAAIVGVAFLRARNRPSRYKKFNLAQIAGIVVLLALGASFGNQIVQVRNGQLRRDRNFYGSLTIYHSPGPPEARFLVHGRTSHGYQLLASPKTPTMYYGPNSGLGLFMQARPMCFGPCQYRYGLIGMGVGTIAAYGRPGEVMRFYEINPQVINYSFAPNPYFTFIRDSEATIEVAPGDARLSLERELTEHRPGQFDLLVVDAFNSDAIPVHLLTQEALSVYLAHLRSADSVIAFHISNRTLDLRLVLAALAARNRLWCVRLHKEITTRVDENSDWVLMSRTQKVLDLPAFRDHIAPMPPGNKAILWTDDYSNLFRILRYSGS